MSLQDDKIGRFSLALKELKGEAHYARNEQEFIRTLESLLIGLDDRRERVVVCAGLPKKLQLLVSSRQYQQSSIQILDGIPGENAVRSCAEAGIGITWAEFAIVSHGALVEIAYNDVSRLASSLPYVHIALVHAERLLDSLPTAMSKVGSIVRAKGSSSSGPRPVVSIISGPSKTSDIELRLLYGVHGPVSLHVIIVGWPVDLNC